MHSRDEAKRFGSWSISSRHLRLIRSGISSVLDGSGKRKPVGVYRSRYAVHVSGLRAIEAMKVEGEGRSLRYPIALNPETAGSPSLLRQLEKMAVRALYTLGLSSGEVVLVSGGGDRKYAVEQVTPSAWFEDVRIERMYSRAEREQKRRLEEESSHGYSLMLGMDPEFVLVNPRSGEVIPASLFLDREGEVGCDAVHGENGAAVAYPIAELRPRPSRDAHGLLIGLMRTLRMAAEMIDDRSLIWQAGGMPKAGLPLGGHLHFSGIELTAELLRTLDNYLALPIAILEAHGSQLRRPKYGYLGDFRRQPHGGFEYRTLPSFLVSPLLAKGIIYLSSLIVTNYRSLIRRPLDDEENVHQAYYQGQREVMREYCEQLISDIESLELYPETERYVEPLFRQIRQGGTWNEQRDIRPLWNIPFRSK
ncbi:hypothetical protein G8C92_17310 [Paenibacillus donghaensis]|uniref:putative amidoligase domain-containing protein n=1 Tax=Paenibacillus donghaensis TaxID=414771 RepID=UPI001883C251|nr:hypothetical protein [Paenibacillus donghaensis]MBE9915776.1 hypothetical protein [Paenibacillus donghaensis]